MTIHVYVEGGSAGVAKTNCRQAFKSFLGKVIPENTFTVIACGDRRRTYEAFKLGIRSHPTHFVVMLVDSEDEVTCDTWMHLNTRPGDQWARPLGVEDGQAHMMVQVMESWFLADPYFLEQYYGNEFRRNMLPRRGNLEQVPKSDVYNSLSLAAQNTRKGRYHKTRDGFPILSGISPVLVRQSFPHAQVFLQKLEELAIAG